MYFFRVISFLGPFNVLFLLFLFQFMMVMWPQACWTTRLNWKVKSMETNIWKIESEVICSFSNVWHTQHQKQDNRHQKKITGTCFVFEPHWSVHLSMTKLAMNDESTKLYKSNCKCHQNHHRQEQNHVFSKCKLWVLLLIRMPSLFLSYRFSV